MLVESKLHMGEFPSGQRGQTVNLLAVLSVVQIHLPPPKVLDAKAFRTFTFYLFTIHFSLKTHSGLLESNR